MYINLNELNSWLFHSTVSAILSIWSSILLLIIVLLVSNSQESVVTPVLTYQFSWHVAVQAVNTRCVAPVLGYWLFDENLLYSFINQISQLNKYLIINSHKNIKNFKINLIDLKSRLNSFMEIQINLPTDELIKVIISKTFSDICNFFVKNFFNPIS